MSIGASVSGKIRNFSSVKYIMRQLAQVCFLLRLLAVGSTSHTTLAFLQAEIEINIEIQTQQLAMRQWKGLLCFTHGNVLPPNLNC